MFNPLSKHYDLCARAFILGTRMTKIVPIPGDLPLKITVHPAWPLSLHVVGHDTEEGLLPPLVFSVSQ